MMILEDFEMKIGPDQLEAYYFDGHCWGCRKNFKRTRKIYC